MRKSRLLVLTLTLSMGLSLAACSKSNVDITTETTTSVVETNTCGLENIDFNTLKSSIDNKDTFYVYIDYKNGILDEEKKQWVKDALTQITQENNITCNFYYISENDLSDDDISYIDDLSKDMVAKEIEFYQKWGNDNEKVKNEDTIGGIYAFKDGDLVTVGTKINAKETFSKLKESFISSIYDALLFEDDHGLEIISYEEVQKKRDNKEQFVLYVGRDSCRDCRAFMPSYEKVTSKYPVNIPVYYLYTQNYKSAINNGEENAQQIWDDLKADLNIEGTPSLIYYVGDGTERQFHGFADETYFDMTEEEKAKKREDVADVLEQWFADNDLSDACKEHCD